MKFQVLLFNFFEDSHVDVSQWRVILNALPEEKGMQIKRPQFDENRHGGVCREARTTFTIFRQCRD